MSIELEFSVPFINLEEHIFCCLVCFKEVLFGEDKCTWCSNPLNWEGIEGFEEDKDNDDNDSSSSDDNSSDTEETKSEVAFRTGTDTSDSEASSSDSSDSEESHISLDHYSNSETTSDSDGGVPIKRQRKH